MPKTATQREKLAAKERAILEAAHLEFAAHGFEGAKMVAIAKRAAVAEGTLYHYYRNKADLLEAVVDQFWRELTTGARSVVKEHEHAIDQLVALARYHLTQLIADYDFVELTLQVGQRHSRHDASLTPIRQYVRVFDEAFGRGIDRGELRSTATCWHWRDLFFGQLEYSARTLILRQQHTQIDDVIDHLRQLLITGVATEASPASVIPHERQEALNILSAELGELSARLALLTEMQK